MGYHYRAQHELVLFFEKGKRKLKNLGIPDIIRVQPIRSGYPTEKPPGVARVLIEQSTEPGALIIDPFLGSGSTWHAAELTGRRFAGCDVEQRAIDHARRRIESVRGEGASTTARAQGGTSGDDNSTRAPSPLETEQP
jgi:site-specific DNA-methyltransferase (adenine-specific)